MRDIKSMTQEEIALALRDLGEPSFRGKQVFTWLHRGACSFGEMTNLSKSLRGKLEEIVFHHSSQGGLQAGLPSGRDGQVSLGAGRQQLYRDGAHALSSRQYGVHLLQVGCRMGCAFCASTIGGKVRNLTAAEMLDQVLFTQLDSGEASPTLSLWESGSPWITWIRCCASWSW